MIKKLLLQVLNFLKSYLFFYKGITKPYIKESKLMSILRKSYREVYKLLFVVFDLFFLLPAIFVVLAVRTLRPYILIRFGLLNSRRIGHFAGNTELYFCKRDIERKQGKRSVDLFFYTHPICNRQLKKMWARILHIYFFVTYLYRVNSCLPGGEENSALKLMQSDRDIHGFFAASTPHLSFTQKENKIGNLSLRRMGIPQGSPFVCLHIRDSKYLNDLFKVDFYYNNYRDCNIKNYKLVAEKLADRGYFVLRMGKNVKERFGTNNPKVIDYATNYRSDFLDIFLSANCHFFIGCAAGFGGVASIFRRPAAWVNDISLEFSTTWGKDHLLIPKKLWLRRESRFLTFREILQSEIARFCQTQQFDRAGIEIVENTPEEILALAIEMDERLKGTWKTAMEDEELQQLFWSYFRKSELNHKFLTRIGAEFLRQNRALLK